MSPKRCCSYVVLIIALTLLLSTPAAADPVTKQVYYEKKTILSGSEPLRFSLWTSDSGGTEVWHEEATLRITGNLIKTYLGQVSSLDEVDFSQQYWIQVERMKKDGTYVAVGIRERFGIVPYALWSSSGVTGPQGPKGDAGAAGPQGAQGPAGPKGDTGAQGPKGDTGEEGAKGDTGDTGPQGPAGSGGIPSGFCILGTTSTAPSGYTYTGHTVLYDTSYWSTRTNMPTARYYLGTAVVSSKIYAIGGNIDQWTALGTNEEYDPGANTWATKQDMPTARSKFAIAVVDGKIYVIGGIDSSGQYLRTNEEYNPDTNTWVAKASIPEEPTISYALSAAAVNGKIYLFGLQNTLDADPWWEWVTYEYNPAADTWATRAGMPYNSVGDNMQDSLAIDINDKIYVMNTASFDGIHYEYNPGSDTWATRVAMPSPREWFAISKLNNKIYAIGGMAHGADEDVPSVLNDEYNPVTNAWVSKPSMFNKRMGLSAAAANGKIYAIGGYDYDADWNIAPAAFNEEYNQEKYYYLHMKD